MTRRDRRFLSVLTASTALAMASALTAGPWSVALAAASVGVLLARLAWRRAQGL